MTDASDPHDDPAVTGVPPETPEQVRPSATGLVTGPIDGQTDVVVADVHVPGTTGAVDAESLDQTLQDAEGGIEGSALDTDEA
jgi:hypothetical protein